MTDSVAWSTEMSVIAVGAGVYRHDPQTNSWVPTDKGMSRVDLFNSISHKSYRIVGKDIKTSSYTLHVPVVPGLVYERMSDTFHQCTTVESVEGQLVYVSYGLNFRTHLEAEQFGEKIEELQKLITVKGALPEDERNTTSTYQGINSSEQVEDPWSPELPSTDNPNTDEFSLSDSSLHHTIYASGTTHDTPSSKSARPPAHPPPPVPTRKKSMLYFLESSQGREEESTDNERTATGATPRRRAFAESGKRSEKTIPRELEKERKPPSGRVSRPEERKTNFGGGGEKKTPGVVTQEDFEQFKKEIFSYIDQAKMEIMGVINRTQVVKEDFIKY